MRAHQVVLWVMLIALLCINAESRPASKSSSRSSSRSSSFSRRGAAVRRPIFAPRPHPVMYANRGVMLQPRAVIPQPRPVVVRRIGSPFRVRTNTVLVPVSTPPTTVTNYVDPATGEIVEQVIETPRNPTTVFFVAGIIFALILCCIATACAVTRYRPQPQQP